MRLVMKLWEPTDDDGNPKPEEAVYQFTVKISVVAREGQTGESTAWLTDATRPDGSANPLAELALAQYLLANPDKTLKNLHIFRSPYGDGVSLRELLETAATSVITTKYSCFLPICARFKVALKGLVRSDAYKRLVWSQWVDAIELVAIPKRDAVEEINPEERDQLEAMYAPPVPSDPPPLTTRPLTASRPHQCPWFRPHSPHRVLVMPLHSRSRTEYADTSLPPCGASLGAWGPGHINSLATAAPATACIPHGCHAECCICASTT